MNGTHSRIALALACTAALAAPGSAMAAKKHRVHATKTPAPTIVLHHTYDAGGDGAGALAPKPGVRVNLFDPVNLARSLGNGLLGQLGLPPLPALPQLPQLPTP